MKDILFDRDARVALAKGASIVSRAVTSTLGPKGRNVALDRQWGAPSVVHDGVSVAQEVDVKDRFQNMGAQLVKQAASRTNDEVGDGTTTSILLADEMIREGMKYLDEGGNPMFVRSGMEKALEVVTKEIDKIAIPIKDRKAITQVATISAGDPGMGEKIAEALEKVGEDGIVTVEESNGLTIEVEHKEGMQFEQGFVSPYFITNPDGMYVQLEKPYILITDKKLSSATDIVPFLSKFLASPHVSDGRKLLIIADEIEGEALTLLVYNKLRGQANVAAVKAPSFGNRQKEILSDIAFLTGGIVISQDTGRTLESVTELMEELGRADNVWINREICRIIGGRGKKEAIDDRINQIKTQLEKEKSEYEKDRLQERLAKLTGGVAVIKVGAATEAELAEKRERAKDAVEATKAAVQGGIVPGAGLIQLRVREALKSLVGSGKDEQTGIDIVYDALESPFRKLVENAGENPDIVMRDIEEKKSLGPNRGIDISTGEVCNLIERGIIDPARVTKVALRNAVSVASSILTTNTLVADDKEEKPEA